MNSSELVRKFMPQMKLQKPTDEIPINEYRFFPTKLDPEDIVNDLLLEVLIKCAQPN